MVNRFTIAREISHLCLRRNAQVNWMVSSTKVANHHVPVLLKTGEGPKFTMNEGE